MREFVIDGNRFVTLSEFYDEIEAVLIPGQKWGRNLDAFNDILSWVDETIPYRIVWKNAALSQERLGYDETASWLSERRANAHSSNRSHLEKRFEDAKRGYGETLFEQIVGIIRRNRSYVDLVLE